jgi:hypothetical protein
MIGNQMVSCQALVSPAGDAGTIEEGTDRAQSNEGACCDAERRSPKRDRQYQHIKDGLLDRGEGEDEAEEIAARTVNRSGPVPAKRRRQADFRSRTSRLLDGVAFAHIGVVVDALAISCTRSLVARTCPADRR